MATGPHALSLSSPTAAGTHAVPTTHDHVRANLGVHIANRLVEVCGCAWQ